MGAAIYILCALAALGCAWLLLQSYFRSGNRLLLWSGLCFAGLTLSNFLVVVDLTLVPGGDLYTWRNGTTLLAISLLLYGLIWDS